MILSDRFEKGYLFVIPFRVSVYLFLLCRLLDDIVNSRFSVGDRRLELHSMFLRGNVFDSTSYCLFDFVTSEVFYAGYFDLEMIHSYMKAKGFGWTLNGSFPDHRRFVAVYKLFRTVLINNFSDTLESKLELLRMYSWLNSQRKYVNIFDVGIFDYFYTLLESDMCIEYVCESTRIMLLQRMNFLLRQCYLTKVVEPRWVFGFTTADTMRGGSHFGFDFAYPECNFDRRLFTVVDSCVYKLYLFVNLGLSLNKKFGFWYVPKFLLTYICELAAEPPFPLFLSRSQCVIAPDGRVF